MEESGWEDGWAALEKLGWKKKIVVQDDGPLKVGMFVLWHPSGQVLIPWLVVSGETLR